MVQTKSKCTNYTLKWYNPMTKVFTSDLTNFTNPANLSRFHTFASLEDSECLENKVQTKERNIDNLLRAKRNFNIPQFGRQSISSTESVMNHKILCKNNSHTIDNSNNIITLTNLINF